MDDVDRSFDISLGVHSCGEDTDFVYIPPLVR